MDKEHLYSLQMFISHSLFSQNHRIVEIGANLLGLPSPTSLPPSRRVSRSRLFRTVCSKIMNISEDGNFTGSVLVSDQLCSKKIVLCSYRIPWASFCTHCRSSLLCKHSCPETIVTLFLSPLIGHLCTFLHQNFSSGWRVPITHPLLMWGSVIPLLS